jgi:hypothetical protein
MGECPEWGLARSRGREEGEEGAVSGEVWGGGGAEGAEAVEEVEEEEDQGFFGGGEADAGRGLEFEGALVEGAAEVEALMGREATEDGGEAEVEAAMPGGAEGEDAGEDGVRFLGAGGTAWDPDGGAAEGADGGGLAGGVLDEAGVEILFDLEDGVDGFGRDVEAGGVREEERGIEAVVDGDVDLAGAVAA